MLLDALCPVDPAPYLDAVSGLSDSDWWLDGQRKRSSGHVAYETESIRPGVAAHLDAMLDSLRETVAPVLDALYPETWTLGQFVLSRMRAGSRIRLHRDQRRDPMHMRRLHVPITTNDGVVTIFPTDGGERLHMSVGSLWEFNFRRPHRVENAGDTERVHLVFDLYTPTVNRRVYPGAD